MELVGGERKILRRSTIYWYNKELELEKRSDT
jgi:hypothetical protein